MTGRYANVRIFNHHWERADTFRTLGVIPASEIEAIGGGLFARTCR